MDIRSCEHCEKSKHDCIWGEYKCLFYSRRIHDTASEAIGCPEYKYTNESKIEENSNDSE